MSKGICALSNLPPTLKKLDSSRNKSNAYNGCFSCIFQTFRCSCSKCTFCMYNTTFFLASSTSDAVSSTFLRCFLLFNHHTKILSQATPRRNFAQSEYVSTISQMVGWVSSCVTMKTSFSSQIATFTSEFSSSTESKISIHGFHVPSYLHENSGPRMNSCSVHISGSMITGIFCACYKSPLPWISMLQYYISSIGNISVKSPHWKKIPFLSTLSHCLLNLRNFKPPD